MPPSRALVSLSAVVDPVFRQEHLKLCALWYDEVLVETIGDYHTHHFLEQIVGDDERAEQAANGLRGALLPLRSKVSSEVIADEDPRFPRGYPRWGIHGEYN